MMRNFRRYAIVLGILSLSSAGSARADCLVTLGLISGCTVWGDQVLMPPLWPAWRVAHIYYPRHAVHHRHHHAGS